MQRLPAALLLAAAVAWAGPDAPFRPWRTPREVRPDPIPPSFNAMTTVAVRPMGPKLKGKVVGPSGPLAGARVISVSSNAGAFNRGPLNDPCPLTVRQARTFLEGHLHEGMVFGRTSTSADGTFEVGTNGNPGIWVDAPGYGAKLVLVGNVAEVSQLQIGVGPGAYAQGTVVDESRQPLAFAIVTAVHPDGRYFDALTTDAGTFTLGAFDAPPSQVYVRRAGYLTRIAAVGGEAPIVMHDPRSLRVTVFDDRGPAVRSQVTIGTHPCAITQGTDANGVADFKELPPGEYPIWVGTHLKGAQRTVTLSPDDGDRVLARLNLRETAGLELEVFPLPADASPVTVTLDCGGDFGAVRMRQVIAGRGRFSAAHLPGGPCVAEVEGPGLASGVAKPFALVAGQTVVGRIDLPVPRIFHVRVGVLDPKGRAVPEAVIHYARPGEASSYRVGSLELTEGMWEVWATAEGQVSEKRVLVLPSDHRSQPAISLAVDKAPRVRGTVTDAKGKKVAGVTLSVHCGPGDPALTAISSASGDFDFQVEETGECVLRATRTIGGLTEIHEQPLRLAVNGKVQAPVRLAPILATRGFVLEADGGRISGPLKLSSDLSQAEAMATDGGFALGLTPGTWRVWSAGPEWKVARGEFAAGSMNAAVEVTRIADVASADAGTPAPQAPPDAGRPLGPEAIAGVRAITAQGVPIAGARVEAWTPGSKIHGCRHPDALFTDAVGRGWVELRPGQKVLVSAPRFVATVVAGTPDGGAADVRLAKGTVRLEGSVARDGAPVVADLCLEGPSGQAATSSATGQFAFDDLPEGTYTLSARSLGRTARAAAVVQVDVKRGAPPVVLTLTRP